MPGKKRVAVTAKVRAIVWLLTLSLVTVVLLSVRKDHLDSELARAVSEEDAAHVHQLLAQGADARGFVHLGAEPSSLALLLSRFSRQPAYSLPAGVAQPQFRANQTRRRRRVRPRSLLMEAVQASNTKIVEDLLSHGADLNYALDNGSTALFLCVDRFHGDCLAALLRHGASIHDRNAAGQTPLHIAARSNAASNILCLLDHGADLSAKDRLGRSALALADWAHAPDAVCALLDRGANPADLKAPGAVPALAWGSWAGYLPLVKRLWEKVLSPQDRAAQSADALLNAVQMDRMDVVTYLLERGVGVNPEQSRPFISADTAAAGADVSRMADTIPSHMVSNAARAVNIRSRPIPRPSLLVAAASTGDPELFNLLLAHGARVNPGSRAGDPLTACVRVATGQLTTIVTNPVRISAAPSSVRARRLAWRAVILNLLAKGANVHAVDPSGTVLMAAVQDPYLLDLLIAMGADVNARDLSGRTPLMLACQDQGGAVDLLLAAGARVNDSDQTGTTPLMYAIASWPPAQVAHKVRLLLKHGANPNACDRHSQTALTLMWRNPMVQTGAGGARDPRNEVESLLKKAGAKFQP